MTTSTRQRAALSFPPSRLAHLVAALVLAAPFVWRVNAQSTPADRSGADVYRAACAACHGPDGKGAPKSRVGFDVALPDFSNCAFATPEPDADWIAVVHRGGRVRAFDRLMPAFGEALTDREIERAVAHLRGFCADRSWPRGELNLPRALVTEKAFPENEAVLTTAFATGGPAAVDQEIVYERRFGARNQIEIAVPFSAARDVAPSGQGQSSPGASSGSQWRGGLGDLAIGVKRALVHSLERGSILGAGAEIVLPTAKDGLGNEVTMFEPFLAFGQILRADGFLQGQAGVELSTDRGRAAHEAFWRAAIGRSFAQQRFGRTWSPMIEIVGVRELEAGHAAEWDVIPQMQVTLSTRQHVMLSGGLRLPVTERASRRRQVMIYVLWDWMDGGLGSGW